MPTQDLTTEYMLTTIDNPFDPFTQYEEWYAWDARADYHTPEYLARIARSSDDLSDPDRRSAINQAIDEIVHMNILGVYRKVAR